MTNTLRRATPAPRPVLATAAALALFAGGPVAAQAPRLGKFLRQVDGLAEPTAVAFTADGAIIVAERDADAVRRIEADGTLGPEWRPSFDGIPLRAPSGLAVSGDRTYVADLGHDRVLVLGPAGAAVAALGGFGAEPGRLDRPAGIAVSGDRVAVADAGNDRIQIFAPDGALVAALGSRGTEPGSFRGPQDVAFAADGTLYVADTGNHRIQKLSPDGAVLRTWGERGAFPGLMIAPAAVAVAGDRVYVADGLGHRVQVFDPDGAFVAQWGMHAVVPREGEGRIHYPSGLAVARDGQRVVVAEGFENRVQIFGPLAEGERAPGAGLAGALDEQSHFGPMLSTSGPLLVTWEPPNGALIVFDLAAGRVPIQVTSFGEPGERYGQLADPTALLLRDGGRWLDVADAGTRRAQRFRIDREPEAPVRYDPFLVRFAKAWNLDAGERSIDPIALVAVDDGRTLLLDRRANEIVELDASYEPIRRFGGRGDGPGRLTGPADMDVDRERDRVYVVDALARRIEVYRRADGESLATWTHPDLRRPAGIAVTRDGRVLVSDRGADVVFVFDAGGALVDRIGGTGSEHGQFWKPGRLVEDEQGRIIVVDYGNHRLQAFDRDGQWLMTFSTGRAYTR